MTFLTFETSSVMKFELCLLIISLYQALISLMARPCFRFDCPFKQISWGFALYFSCSSLWSMVIHNPLDSETSGWQTLEILSWLLRNITNRICEVEQHSKFIDSSTPALWPIFRQFLGLRGPLLGVEFGNSCSGKFRRCP